METYLDLCAKFYEADKPDAPKDALDFYMSYARQTKGKILEPMCGTGRFLLPLLESGLDVVGFDASTHMLEILQEKISDKNFKNITSQCSIEDFNWAEDYNLVFIPSGSFGLVTCEKAVKDFLSKIHKSLHPEGILVFEFETLKATPVEIGIWKGRYVSISDSQEILLSTCALPLEGNMVTTICRYELIEHGKILKTEVESLKITLYDPGILVSWIREAGFKDVKQHQTYKRNIHPTIVDEVIVLECIK